MYVCQSLLMATVIKESTKTAVQQANDSKTPRTDRHQSKNDLRPVRFSSIGPARSRTGNWTGSYSTT